MPTAQCTGNNTTYTRTFSRIIQSIFCDPEGAFQIITRVLEASPVDLRIVRNIHDFMLGLNCNGIRLSPMFQRLGLFNFMEGLGISAFGSYDETRRIRCPCGGRFCSNWVYNYQYGQISYETLDTNESFMRGYGELVYGNMICSNESIQDTIQDTIDARTSIECTRDRCSHDDASSYQIKLLYDLTDQDDYDRRYRFLHYDLIKEVEALIEDHANATCAKKDSRGEINFNTISRNKREFNHKKTRNTVTLDKSCKSHIHRPSRTNARIELISRILLISL